MKKFILVLFIFILSGCSATYNLEIDGDTFKENIDIIINKSEIPNDNSLEFGVEQDDPITPFLNGENSVFFSNPNVYYNKKVEEFGDYYSVNMNYQYRASEFKDSNSLNMCFDSFEFDDSKNYYIHAEGAFYCLYPNTLSISIKTRNKVIKNNADEIKGNVYTWIIDNNNRNNVDIEFEITKNVSYTNILVYIVIIVLCISGILFIKSFIQKNKENNKI